MTAASGTTGNPRRAGLAGARTATTNRHHAFLAALAAVAVGSAFATVAGARALTPSASRLGDPVAFLRRVVSEIAANQYATAWRTLAPAQQRLVSRAAYVACESLSPIPGKLASLTVVKVFKEPVTVAGPESADVQATAVTFRIEIVGAALRDSVVVQHTVHAVEASGRWAWILPATRLGLDRSPGCGAGKTPAYER